MCGIVGGCLGSCASSAACSCAKSVCGGSRRSGTGFYMTLFAIVAFISLLFRYWKGLSVNLYVYKFTLCDTTRCVGSAGVYRLMFGAMLFFLVMGGVALLVSSPSRFDRKYFLLKGLAFTGFVVLAWFLPHEFYNDFYIVILRGGAGLFILFQVAALVHSVHLWHERWLARNWLAPILIVSVLFVGASAAILTFAFKFFTSDTASCSTHNGLLITTIVIIAVFLLLSISPLSRNGVLPAAVLGTHCCYLLFSGLFSSVDGDAIFAHGKDPCNSLASRGSTFKAFQTIFGVIFSLATVAYAAYTTSNSARKSDAALTGSERYADLEAGNNGRDYQPPAVAGAQDDVVLNPSSGSADGYDDVPPAPSRSGRARRGRTHADADAEDDASAASDDDDDEDEAEVGTAAAKGKARALALGHLVLALGCCSVAATLTTWGYDAEVTPAGVTRAGEIGLWVKMVSQWLASAVYIWTFFAPICLSNREFD